MDLEKLFDLYGFILNEEHGKVFFSDDDDKGGADDIIDDDDKGGVDDDIDKMKAYYEEEKQQNIKRRNNALKRAQAAEKKLDELSKKLETVPSMDEYKSLQEEHDKMKGMFEEIEEKRKEDELKKIKDEKERERARAAREFEKEKKSLEDEISGMKKQLDEVAVEREAHNKTLARLRKEGLKAEILSSAAKAFNPHQVVKLLMSEFNYDESEDSWMHEVTDNKGKITDYMTVQERVEAFLADPDNENLLAAPVKSGSGSRQRQSGGEGGEGLQNLGEITDEMLEWAYKDGFDRFVNRKGGKYSLAKDVTQKDKEWLIATFTKLHQKQVRNAQD